MVSSLENVQSTTRAPHASDSHAHRGLGSWAIRRYVWTSWSRLGALDSQIVPFRTASQTPTLNVTCALRKQGAWIIYEAERSCRTSLLARSSFLAASGNGQRIKIVSGPRYPVADVRLNVVLCAHAARVPGVNV